MQTIVWDVDDVLNELMKNWYERKWLPEHPLCAVRYEALTQNPPHELLGAGREEYLQSLDAFRLSDEGRQLPPGEEVMDWFRTHGHRFRHIALTATPIECAPHSAAWVIRNFGNWIRTFAFVPSQRRNDRGPAYDMTKKDYLAWWGKADVLVDDNPGHVEAAKQLGIHALLVPQPWNHGEGSLKNVLQELGRL
jgi:hypothetical protein